MNNTLLALKIGLEIHKEIYKPLLKYKKSLSKHDYFTLVDYFITFLNESISRLDILDFDYFKFQTWNVPLFNDVYYSIVSLTDRYYKVVGEGLYLAIKRMFENIKDYKV